MTNLSYFDRKKQLVAVFNDTLQRIGSNRDLQAAVSQSIASQQYIGDADKIDLPAAPYTEKAQVVVSRLRSFEVAVRTPSSTNASFSPTTRTSAKAPSSSTTDPKNAMRTNSTGNASISAQKNFQTGKL